MMGNEDDMVQKKTRLMEELTDANTELSKRQEELLSMPKESEEEKVA